jgi:multidrug efflux system membrane fusion protein
MESPFQFHKDVAGEAGPVKRITPSFIRRAGLAVALILAAAIALHVVTGLMRAQKDKDAHAVPVTAALAEAKPVPVQLSTIGHVEPISAVIVRARIDGQVTAVAVREGQSVKKGDVLFQLDDRQARAALDQAVATLARDQAQLAYARKQAERQKGLMRNDFVSHSQYDQATSTAEAMAGTVASDQAQVENAQTALSFTTLTAPIDGRIGSIGVKEGNTVQASSTTPLLTINQIAPIYVSFSVPQDSLAALREAVAAGTVQVSATPTGDEKPPAVGTVAFYENAIDAATGTLGVRGVFTNEDERLWPGQFAEVVVTLRIEPNAITVPATAVEAGQNGSYVFVIKPDKSVELRPVTVSRSVGDVVVIASGLTPGDEVVTSGQLRLVPGAKIRLADDKPGDKGADKSKDGAAP